MSDPKPAADKKPGEKVEGPSILPFVLKVFGFILFFVIALFLVSINPETTITFIFILQLLQISSVLIIIFCIYKVIRYNSRFQTQVHDIEHIYEHKYHPPHKDSNSISPLAKRLEKVKEHIYSQSSSEWKLAIIEMDTILRDVLNQNNFVGETVADQLKSAGERNFANLDNAWEAHKVRNKIAHEGINFTIDQNEAVRVYRLYMSVFEELKAI
jgi:hypothetical protein